MYKRITAPAAAAPAQPVPTASVTWLVHACFMWFSAIGAALLLLPQAATWREQLLVLPWRKFDVGFYLRIVQHGYLPDDGTRQFHPLYPLTALPFAQLFGDPLLALLLVSTLATLGTALLTERLARVDYDDDTARTAVMVLLALPAACMLFAPYTEALFLFCTAACLYAARRERWWLAGVAGAAAALTRQQGVLLVIPLLIEAWQRTPGRSISERVRSFTRVPAAWAALLPGVGLAAWLAYRTFALSDMQPDLSSVQAFIYSVLVSPSSAEVVPQQALLFPPHALWLALYALRETVVMTTIIDLVLGALYILLAVLAWRQMRASYQAYVVVIFLISFGYHTGPLYPYMGLIRHLLLALPLAIGIAPLLRTPRARFVVQATGLLINALLLLGYVTESWVP